MKTTEAQCRNPFQHPAHYWAHVAVDISPGFKSVKTLEPYPMTYFRCHGQGMETKNK